MDFLMLAVLFVKTTVFMDYWGPSHIPCGIAVVDLGDAELLFPAELGGGSLTVFVKILTSPPFLPLADKNDWLRRWGLRGP